MIRFEDQRRNRYKNDVRFFCLVVDEFSRFGIFFGSGPSTWATALIYIRVAMTSKNDRTTYGVAVEALEAATEDFLDGAIVYCRMRNRVNNFESSMFGKVEEIG
jgi:hypothetical protein